MATSAQVRADCGRAGNVEAAPLGVEHDIGDIGLEAAGGNVASDVDELDGGGADRRPADLQRA